MSMYLVFLGELLLLFLLSKKLINYISQLLFWITKSKSITCYVLALLFLPGTFIHEVSHYCMAKILFVKTWGMTLIPEIEKTGIKLGSVQISKSDPIRRFLIGAAPFFFGILIIIGALFAVFHYSFYENPLLYVLAGYVVFEVGNTMFSSRKDMEGAITLLLFCILLGFLLYFFGFRAPLYEITPYTSSLLLQAEIFLSIPLSIDIGVIILLSIIRNFTVQ